MPDALVEYQLRIRNAANDDDALVVTSTRGGTNPYLSSVPSGDGASFDPLTGVVVAGSFSGRMVDPITSGTSRLLTGILEDAGGRQHLGHRRAYWEFRIDGGAYELLYAGRITRCELVSDIEWEIEIGDWMQAEHEFTAFDLHEDDDLDAYLARWPYRGCLIGGPILSDPVAGDFLYVKDLGGWRFKVTAQGADWTRMELREAYTTPGIPVYVGGTNQPINEMIIAVNDRARDFFAPKPSEWLTENDFGPVRSDFGTFPNLAVLIDGDDYLPINRGFDMGAGNAAVSDPSDLIDRRQDLGRFALVVHGVVGTVGDMVRVAIISRKASDASPIFWTGHPVDLLTELWDEAGIPYDAAAVETVRGQLGATLRRTIRIAVPQQVGKFAEEAIYGPIGIAARGNADGEIEIFCSRILLENNPSVTIDETDVWQGETRAFALETRSAIRYFLLEQTRVRSMQATDAPHFISEQPERFERENADPGAIGTGEQSYRVPGEIHFAFTPGVDTAGWVSGRAHEIFDRWGRGIRVMECHLTRAGAGADVALGDEILVDLPQIPNANKRLLDDAGVAARCMQIVHLTPTIRGKRVKLIDSGPNANAIATVPTLSIAASANAPRNVADLTITNAATLNASEYSVRVQIAITTSGVPAATDYSDVGYFKPTEVPTVAFGLPAVYADKTIYARARSEQFGARPSNWSSVVNVALDAFDPPENLAATPDATDASLCLLEWDNGDDSDGAAVEVRLRLDGEAASAARLINTLPPGSTQYTLEGLVNAEDYIASVNHLDAATGDRSATDEVTFTAGSTIREMDAPILPDGFSFGARSDPIFTSRLGRDWRGGLYGIGVVATEIPGFVEIAEAIETAIDSGVYSAYATVGQVASVAGDWTVWHGVAPNNGRRRQLKARHVGDGLTSSDYTDPVTIMPWDYDALAPYVGATVGSVDLTLAADDANDEYDASWTVGSEPAGITYELWARDVTVGGDWQLIDAGAATPESFDAFVSAPGGETYDLDSSGAGPEATHEAYVRAMLGGQEVARSVIRRLSTPTGYSITLDTVDLAVQDYGLNTLVASFNDNAGVYDHFHVLLKRTGIDSDYTEMPADQTVFDVGALYGWDIDAAGLNTRSLEIVIVAHSAAHVELGRSAEIPQFDFSANDDL